MVGLGWLGWWLFFLVSLQTFSQAYDIGMDRAKCVQKNRQRSLEEWFRFFVPALISQ
jgi:hypothetical protein